MDAISPIEPNNVCEICVCLKSLKTTKKVIACPFLEE